MLREETKLYVCIYFFVNKALQCLNADFWKTLSKHFLIDKRNKNICSFLCKKAGSFFAQQMCPAVWHSSILAGLVGTYNIETLAEPSTVLIELSRGNFQKSFLIPCHHYEPLQNFSCLRFELGDDYYSNSHWVGTVMHDITLDF